MIRLTESAILDEVRRQRKTTMHRPSTFGIRYDVPPWTVVVCLLVGTLGLMLLLPSPASGDAQGRVATVGSIDTIRIEAPVLGISSRDLPPRGRVRHPETRTERPFVVLDAVILDDVPVGQEERSSSEIARSWFELGAAQLMMVATVALVGLLLIWRHTHRNTESDDLAAAMQRQQQRHWLASDETDSAGMELIPTVPPAEHRTPREAPAELVLVARDPSGTESRVPLSSGVVSIGSGAECRVRVDEPGVGGVQAMVSRADGHFVLTRFATVEQGSDETIGLNDGSRFTIGHTDFLVASPPAVGGASAA